MSAPGMRLDVEALKVETFSLSDDYVGPITSTTHRDLVCDDCEECPCVCVYDVIYDEEEGDGDSG